MFLKQLSLFTQSFFSQVFKSTMDRIVLESNNNGLIIPTKIYSLSSYLLRFFVDNKFNSNDVPYSCCAVGHPWNPSCFQSHLHLFNGCMKESFQIYGFLYLVIHEHLFKKLKTCLKIIYKYSHFLKSFYEGSKYFKI